MENLTMGERNPKNKSVYVVELELAVSERGFFKKKNPYYVEGQPCVYVGMTGRTPTERFAVHKSDSPKGSRKVRRFGIKLLPELYEHLNPMSWDEVNEKEKGLAEELRGRGYGVVQS